MNADNISRAALAAAESHAPACAFCWIMDSSGRESSDMLLPKGINRRQLGAVLAQINKHLAQLQDQELPT